MAIDPNIVLATQGPQIQPLAQTMQQVLTLKNLGQQQRAAQQEAQLNALKLGQLQGQQQDRNTLDQAFSPQSTMGPGASGPTQPGAAPTRDQILAAVPGHLKEQVQAHFDAADEAAAKVKKAKDDAQTADLDYLGTIGAGVRAFGYTPGAAQVAIQHATAQSAGDPQRLQQIQQVSSQLQDHPELIKPVVDAMIAQSPKQRDLDAKVTKPATTDYERALTRAETEKGAPLSSAEELAFRGQFEGASQPGAAETARHDQAMEAIQKLTVGREQAAQQETARHNKATETAANPLGVGLPAVAGATGASPATLTGDDFLKTLDPKIAGEVKAYAEGRRPFPAGFALKSPYFQQLIQMVGQYDPTFDAANYNARNKARTDFTSGKSAQTINALNTVIGHIDNLRQKADALNNFHEGDLSIATTAANRFKNALKNQSGTGAVPSFETTKKAVTDELTRTWRQAGGTEADIKSWGENIANSNTPEAMSEVLKTMAGLLESKLSASQSQRDTVLGKAGADIPIITPQSRAILDRLQGKGAPASGTVTMKAPNGQTQAVPADQVDHYKSLGAVVVP